MTEECAVRDNCFFQPKYCNNYNAESRRIAISINICNIMEGIQYTILSCSHNNDGPIFTSYPKLCKREHSCNSYR